MPTGYGGLIPPYDPLNPVIDPGTNDPSPPVPDPVPDPETDPDGTAYEFTLNDVLAMAPGLPAALAQIVLDTWIETGQWALALAAMHNSPLYDEYFPGARRDDGSLRYEWDEYLTLVEGFRSAVDDLGINPDLFGQEYVGLITGGVSMGEFEERLDTLASRVLVQSDAMRAHFAQELGVSLSDEAMIAALMSPNVNDALLTRQITEAEILTEATIRGFDASSFDERLYEFGVDRQQAAQLFSSAVDQLPILDQLAQRHNDPDDDFSLLEFVNAMTFGNRTQRLRYQRLFAADAALFKGTLGIAQDSTGALAGLAER